MRIQRQGALLLMGALLLTPASGGATSTSFREVRNRVFAEPADGPRLMYLPEVRAVAGLLNGVLLRRSARTLAVPSDFKDSVPKLVHGLGVCAEAIWEIDAPSPATGLLARGTRVPALLRFSSGTNRTVWTPPIPRIFGISIKVFPTQDLGEPVETRNLVAFDQYGLNGTFRPGFFNQLPGGPPLVFSNVALGSLPQGWLTWGILRFFSPAPLVRPLLPFTSVTAHNQSVDNPVTPYLITFIPRVAQPPDGSTWDFRRDLLQLPPGALTLDIVLPAQPGIPEALRIGSISVQRMVMSETCDQSLHFQHHPWVDPAEAKRAAEVADAIDLLPW